MKKPGRPALLQFLFYVCVFSFVSIFSFAELKVETSISDTNLEVGDQVSYTVTIVSDKKLTRPGPEFKPPLISGLDYMGVSESSSTGITFSGSQRSSVYKFSSVISYACMKEGEYQIPSLNLGLPGGLKTKSLRFKVYKKLPSNLKKKRSSTAGRRRNRMNSLLDRFMGFGGGNSSSQSTFEPEFFVEAELDKSEVFQGEQLVATWYVYLTSNTSLSSFDTLEFPTLRGFWKEDVNFASRFYWKPVLKNGKRYIRSELSSYALTPYNPGDLEIDSFKLRAVVSPQSFFSQKRKVLLASSKPATVKVKPLPDPKPNTFLGGVGVFKIDSTKASGKQEVLYGDPFVYTVRVIGDKSTTKFIKAPKIDVGSEFVVYNVDEDYKFIPQRLSSYTDFKYTLVPKKEGLHQIPEIKISFLNSETGLYEDFYAKPPLFKVLPNKAAQGIKDTEFERGLELEAQKKADVFKPIEGVSWSDYIYLRLPFQLHIVGLVIVFFLGFFIFMQLSKVTSVQEDLIQKLEERTQSAAQKIKSGDAKEALAELINVYSLLIGGVLGKRFGIEGEFSKAAKDLPASLKSSSEQLQNLNVLLQELRFGSSLESFDKKAKLEECLKQFDLLFTNLRAYLK